jgi:hypothetical protein
MGNRFENGTTSEAANEMVLITDGWSNFYPEILRLAESYACNELGAAVMTTPLTVPFRLSSQASSIKWLEENAADLCQEVQQALKRVPRDEIPEVTEEDLLQWRRWLLWRIISAKQEKEI